MEDFNEYLSVFNSMKLTVHLMSIADYIKNTKLTCRSIYI